MQRILAMAGRAMVCLVLLGGAAQANTILYDGALASSPSAQGWAFLGFGSGVETLGGGAVTLDTTAFNASQFGYGRSDTVLNSGAAVSLSFTVQLLNESHASTDRAGFSVLMLDMAHRGVELGFWTDRIFAQAVGFTHGEEVALNTNALLDYTLTLAASGYRLTVNDGTTDYVLSGALRDYSAGAPAVYAVPNALFFGDDTTSAAGRFSLAAVSVTEVPEPGTAVLVLGGLAMMVGRRVGGRGVVWG